jgi:endoglucanase
LFDLKAHLKSLVEVHAPSGHEGAARDLLRDSWAGLVDRFEQDRLGSLIGIKPATHPVEPARKIMIAAHIDEIGMMVRQIVDGFLFIKRVAGVDGRVMPAQPVMVLGREPVPGIVATTPPHLLDADQRRKYQPLDDLVIDLGLPANEVARLVRVGDLVTLDVPMTALQNGRVMGKAMDDRACVAALTACLQHLQTLHHHWDVYAAATVQEETGLFGAATAAYQIQPDIAIALDVTFAPQPGVNGDETCELGGGPAIGIGANFHPKLVEKIQATAAREEIKLQDDIIPGNSGTDAWAIQVSQAGIPTALLQVPLRNMHSPVETVELKDIERLGRLLARFIADLDADFLAAMTWDDAKTTEAAS